MHLSKLKVFSNLFLFTFYLVVQKTTTFAIEWEHTIKTS